MSEMVERVARAIAEKNRGADLWSEMSDDSDIDYIGKTEYLEMARAAIMAMREPTEEMCEAGQEVNNLSEEAGHFEFLSRDEMTESWQAMIDEALK